MREQPGRYQRSAGGMVGAMLVLILLVVGFVAFRALNRSELENPVRPVDYQKTLDYARSEADFPVLAPATLPNGWRATSVGYMQRPERWHLGLLTDEDRYVGLEQARRSLDTMVATYVDQDAVRGGVVEVDARTWLSWTDTGGDTALTRVEGGVTTLVVSSADREVLVDFVRSLR